jgi:hypothetical protein
MPITVITAPHGANKFSPPLQYSHYGSEPTPFYPKDANAFFQADTTYEAVSAKIIASSYDPNGLTYYKSNGLVHSAIDAYNNHYHLTIRPDDVWISIITQLSFYINAHAEELSEKFVKHKGKKELKVMLPPSTIDNIDFTFMSLKMTELLDENLVDKELKNWILPAFSTTTLVDTTVSAIVMMASMKSYFGYCCETFCGIPSVTLDGTKQDWLEVQNRLNKLDEFGEQTRLWATMLKPVLAKFIAAFDGETDDAFWGHIASPFHMGSGSPTLGGWITAFCAFDTKGKFTGPAPANFIPEGWNFDYSKQKYTLDDIVYPVISQSDIPVGSVEVDLKVIEYGVKEYETIMIAGNMGMKVNVGEGTNGDGVQNVPMWCVCLKR